mmetsp:Transcript_42567/g.92508  ORF Transcript_42567/g.92508 Transcript_42567/m.92508 type:complete len:112 (-) Transcript_42567:309-644(-)
MPVIVKLNLWEHHMAGVFLFLMRLQDHRLGIKILPAKFVPKEERTNEFLKKFYDEAVIAFVTGRAIKVEVEAARRRRLQDFIEQLVLPSPLALIDVNPPVFMTLKEREFPG